MTSWGVSGPSKELSALGVHAGTALTSAYVTKTKGQELHPLTHNFNSIAPAPMEKLFSLVSIENRVLVQSQLLAYVHEYTFPAEEDG